MSELPTGTVTFLFSDIEGSTRLLDELGAERYAEILADHRSALLEAIDRHGGIEVDRQGDSLFAAFRTTPGALAAATEGQTALRASSVRVRMGLHTGTPLVADGGYVGMDVHRAARIAAAAHGGQIVLSASSAALLPPEGLLDLGVHRFKDLAAPERVWQVGEGDFPPLASLYRTNLPVPATPFLGRARELEDVAELLVHDDLRVLTLAGPGGAGKTRLALQAAAEVAEDFADGVFWVSLATLAEPALVLPAVAEALGLRAGHSPDLAETVRRRLEGKRTLLLLDNAEHLLPAVASDVASLTALDGPRLLVTSRQRLELRAERLYDIGSLSDDDAVELFLARAAALDVPVTRSNAVIELCKRLDNLPLALELVAPRLRLFSPEQLLERLSRRLDLFEGPRDGDPRQRTLRATMAWSYDLLEPAEQRLLARLAVFSGGATYDAAETICNADPDRLQSLVDKSLVRRRVESKEPRFWMLETVRQFALERLENPRDVARAHAGYYASLTERLSEGGGEEANAALGIEGPNIRGALTFARESGDTTTQLRLLTTAGGVFLSGSQREFAIALEEALAGPTTDLKLRGLGERDLAFAAYRWGDYRASRAAAERALELAERSDNDRLTASALNALGMLAVVERDFEQARRLHERVLNLHRAAGNAHGAAVALVNLGDAALVAGDYERAIKLTGDGLELAEAHGESLVLQIGLVNLAAAYVRLDRVAEAEAAAAKSLAAVDELPDQIGVVFCLRVFAAAALLRDETERSALLLGAADALVAELEARSDPSERALREEVVGRLEDLLGPEEVGRALERGRRLRPEEAVELALSTRAEPGER
jgi:predicted ATPase